MQMCGQDLEEWDHVARRGCVQIVAAVFDLARVECCLQHGLESLFRALRQFVTVADDAVRFHAPRSGGALLARNLAGEPVSRLSAEHGGNERLTLPDEGTKALAVLLRL